MRCFQDTRTAGGQGVVPSSKTLGLAHTALGREEMVRMLPNEFRSAAPATNHFGDLLRPINSMPRACAACLTCSDPDNEQFIILSRACDLVKQAFPEYPSQQARLQAPRKVLAADRVTQALTSGAELNTLNNVSDYLSSLTMSQNTWNTKLCSDQQMAQRPQLLRNRLSRRKFAREQWPKLNDLPNRYVIWPSALAYEQGWQHWQRVCPYNY